MDREELIFGNFVEERLFMAAVNNHQRGFSAGPKGLIGKKC